MPTPPLLSIRDLTIEFLAGGQVVPAVRGVSLDVSAGEVVGIVGESGAGKSATGFAISRLIEPPGRIAGGQVWFDGKRIDDLPERAFRRLRGRRIGMIFQDHQSSLDPLRRIGEDLIETIRAHAPMSKAAARRRAVELLAEVGIPAAEERLRAYPHQLSGGLRQRAAIALALAPAPQLLIADEPTTALDVSVQAQVLALLERIRRERGMSIIFVTHDIGAAAQIADRIAVMYAGRIVELGPTKAVLERPLHPYTRLLMDAVPSVDRRQTRLAQIPGAPPRTVKASGECAFHPRCPYATDSCRSAQPARRELDSRLVECVLYDASAAARPLAKPSAA